jgi:drug/metabolite transporter (DMT)-like permease
VITGTVGFVILIFPSVAAQFVEIHTSNMKLQLVGVIALAIAAISWSVGSLYSSKADLPTNVLISTGMMLFVGGIFLIVLSVAIVELQNFHVSAISMPSMVRQWSIENQLPFQVQSEHYRWNCLASFG